MGEYIGLDVSMKDTAISVRREGKRVWRGKCTSDPEAIARMVRKHTREPERVIFETGPLSVWFYHALQAEGLSAICVDPADICFEITETAALSNLSRTADAMRRMSTKGFRFALDDFGSGMASFNYLQDLPVQFVKIDGEFIKAVLDKPISKIIVEAVTKVARAMNMHTIAESVETADIIPHLNALGLDYAQGFALHFPEPL